MGKPLISFGCKVLRIMYADIRIDLLRNGVVDGILMGRCGILLPHEILVAASFSRRPCFFARIV